MSEIGQGRINCRLGVRRIEVARFGRVMVGAQRDMKCLLDVAHRTGHVQHQTVAVRGCDGQVVLPGKIPVPRA